MTRRWAVIGANSFYGRAFVAEVKRREEGAEVLEFNRPAFNLNAPRQISIGIAAAGCTHVANFAALNMVAESWKHWHDYYAVNVLGVCQVAEDLCSYPDLEGWLQVSTPEVYGTTGVKLEPSRAYFPSTPYANSRAAADAHLQLLHMNKKLPVVFARTVNIYGPGQQPYRVIPRTVLSCELGKRMTLDGGGVSVRDFIYVRDAAAGLYDVADRGARGAIYHLGTGHMVRIVDLVSMVAAMLGKQLDEVADVGPERPGKDMAYLLDWGSTRAGLGWTPQTPLDQGLEATVAWFKKHAHEYRGRDLGYTHRP